MAHARSEAPVIKRIGSHEIAIGVTDKFKDNSGVILGILHTRLYRGHTLHFLIGRFGFYVGAWGTIVPRSRACRWPLRSPRP